MKLTNILSGALIGWALLWTANAHATCDVSSSYTAGQVLTAAQLNTQVTDTETCVNNVLDGDTFTGNMLWHSGNDASFYSDTGSTLKATIDGATGDVIMSPRTLGTAINCEINYAAGTITISGRGGAALSATNPCHIGIRSNSNGVVVTATFVANVTATDGAASQTDGNLFGITDANWANAMPVFVGVVYDGTTPYFTISRKPIVVSGAANTDLCQLTDTDCDGEEDVMILTTGLTLANWVNLPITQVAWLSATYATTGGAWTFAETAYTGFNMLYETVLFTMPVAQNGADASSFLKANGGTSPVFTTNQYYYRITRTGRVVVDLFLDNDGGTDGAGAVTTQIAVPYKSEDNSNFAALNGVASVQAAGTTTINVATISRGTTSLTFIPYAGGAVQHADFTNADRRIYTSIEYQTEL